MQPLRPQGLEPSAYRTNENVNFMKDRGKLKVNWPWSDARHVQKKKQGCSYDIADALTDGHKNAIRRFRNVHTWNQHSNRRVEHFHYLRMNPRVKPIGSFLGQAKHYNHAGVGVRDEAFADPEEFDRVTLILERMFRNTWCYTEYLQAIMP